MRRTSAPSVKNQRSEGSLGLGIPAPTGTVGTSQPAARTRTRLIERKTVPEVPLTGLSFTHREGAGALIADRQRLNGMGLGLIDILGQGAGARVRDRLLSAVSRSPRRSPSRD